MARSLARSKDIALGGFYRRMAGRRGGLIANMALARKLAAWFWRVMVKGDDYIEKGLANYEAQVLQSKQRALKRLAKELGQQTFPSPIPNRHEAFTAIKGLPLGSWREARAGPERFLSV
jgi:transposase